MKISNELLKKMAKVAGILIGVILIILLISLIISNKKYTLKELEEKVYKVTEDYYKQNKNSLPENGETKILTLSHFVETGEIKNPTLKNGDTCTGESHITNNNGFLLIVPVLECGDQKPDTLYNKITNDIVSEGAGLYKDDLEYIYKGDEVNNYITFANRLWRILKINSDGTFRIMETKNSTTSTWDDRYNIEKESSTGINEYMRDGINSRIKDTLESIYQNEKLFSDKDKAYLVKHSLCIGKRSANETNSTGAIECSERLYDQYLGLIQTNEYLNASLDTNCTNIFEESCRNYNYLANMGSTTWTITADSETNHRVFKIQNSVILSNASSSGGVKAIAHLYPSVLYSSGDGTQTSPYQIK